MSMFSRKLQRTTMWVFLLVMPVEVEVDSQDSRDLTLGVHGGAGQVFSILEDCQGNRIAMEKNSFADVAASAEVSQRSSLGIVSVGLRGGYLHSRAPNHGHAFGEPEEYVTYSYWNPYCAAEGRLVGLGFGYLGGEVPFDFGDPDGMSVTGHLRIGALDTPHFLVSLNENLPLASGGGYFNLGIGYPTGRGVQMFTGYSAGFYNEDGVVQQVSLPLSDRFILDLSARVSVFEHFEGGFAAGLRYRIPLQ